MSLFITGTGTDVGKTVFTAGLAALLHAQGVSFCVYKPIQTGCADLERPEDLERVKTLVGVDIPTHCTYCFEPPSAPYAADPGRTIEPHKLLADFKRLQKEYRVVLVEGAGGLRVPVACHFEMIDLIRMFQLPSVLVASPQLGTLNHILLSLEALERRRMEVSGVILSGFPEHTENPAIRSLVETLEAFTTTPVLGALPVLELSPGSLSQPAARQIFEQIQRSLSAAPV